MVTEDNYGKKSPIRGEAYCKGFYSGGVRWYNCIARAVNVNMRQLINGREGCVELTK